MYNELIRQPISYNEDTPDSNQSQEVGFEISQLGQGIFVSGLAPEEGLLVYIDLQKAQEGLVLASELHLLYLLTPVSLQFKVDWRMYH